LLKVIAAFVANLGTINTGLVFGFSAVTIPQLQEADSFIQIDEEQASWIGKRTELVDCVCDLQVMFAICVNITKVLSICTRLNLLD
jgi:hypothetical protein